MLSSYISFIDRTLSGTTTPSQNGVGSNGNEGVLHIPQIFETGVSPSDCLLSYSRHSSGKSYLSAEMTSVYSAAPADWARNTKMTVIPNVVGTLGMVPEMLKKMTGEIGD